MKWTRSADEADLTTSLALLQRDGFGRGEKRVQCASLCFGASYPQTHFTTTLNMPFTSSIADAPNIPQHDVANYLGLLYSTMLYNTIQYNTILYYTILYYTILYYTILYYTILYYTILYYTILYYTILYYTILYYTILYYTILYYTILYYTILYYTILYYTILGYMQQLGLRASSPRCSTGLPGRRLPRGLPVDKGLRVEP